ncbi:L,D-transpeptidase family protein [Nocardioides terrigena]|uniref:L,D-transpeptidase family protein n=1 Tax=Nocardioides terrigena TaxID=424797 RepID=UPI000D30E295|nr:L,D-transpeptidase family protein [Nocardioides terrigena]
MRTLLAVLLLALPLAPAQAAAPAPSALVLDGVRVAAGPTTTQVVTVNHTAGHRARVTYWRLVAGEWVARRRTDDGRTGYGGLVAGDRRVQGTGTTPLGTYGLLSVFGTHPRRDAGALDYRRIRRGDHWVQDNASPHYNRYRNQRQGGFRWWLPSSDPNSSERLTDYRRPYEWSIVTGFNVEQVRHRGSGIFLHVNGRGATAGCVSAPRRFLRALVRRLDPAAAPVIAIGR